VVSQNRVVRLVVDDNRCVHLGLSLYLLTFIGDLRYKILFI